MLSFIALPLAVDAGQIGMIVAMVISFIIWAAQQATSKAKQEDQKKRQAQAAARQRAQQQQQRQRQGQRGAPRASQEDEVDAFLRSAAQQQQPQQRPPAQRPPAPLPSANRPPQTRPQGNRPPTPPARRQPTAGQGRRPAQQRRTQGKPAAKQPLYDGLETSDFGASAASMGHLEGHEHDVEQHVHEVFDHDLGQLDDQIAARDLDTFGDTSLLDADLHPHKAVAGQAAAAQAAQSIEDDIVEMFRNPANIRNAIVMQEILRRPSF